MKTLATLTVASALLLAGAAFAQGPAPADAPPGERNAAQPVDREARGQRPRLSREDRNALTDARVAGIQAGLKLNAEQQRLWGPVEAALRAQANDRADRMDERRRGQPDGQGLDLMQRLDRRAERIKERADAVQALAGAMRPFWASLDENQKRLLPVLMRGGRREGPGNRHHGGHHRHGGMHGHMGASRI